MKQLVIHCEIIVILINSQGRKRRRKRGKEGGRKGSGERKRDLPTSFSNRLDRKVSGLLSGVPPRIPRFGL